MSLNKQVDDIDQDQTARSVQSDLDLCRTQKSEFSTVSRKG